MCVCIVCVCVYACVWRRRRDKEVIVNIKIKRRGLPNILYTITKNTMATSLCIILYGREGGREQVA